MKHFDLLVKTNTILAHAFPAPTDHESLYADAIESMVLALADHTPAEQLLNAVQTALDAYENNVL